MSYIGITYKFPYKQSLYSEIPTVSEKLNYDISKIAKFTEIFVRIEHIKNQGVIYWPKELDWYFPWYGAVKITEILTAPYSL